MNERFKQFGGLVFGAVILLGVVSIPILFILGSTWAATHLLGPLFVAGAMAIAVDLLVLIPLSFVPQLRGGTGLLIFLSSFLFGFITWLCGFVLTYSLWGIWPVVLGLVLFGGAVVPFALLATMLKGMWWAFWMLLLLALVSFGTRAIGSMLLGGIDD